MVLEHKEVPAQPEGRHFVSTTCNRPWAGICEVLAVATLVPSPQVCLAHRGLSPAHLQADMLRASDTCPVQANPEPLRGGWLCTGELGNPRPCTESKGRNSH